MSRTFTLVDPLTLSDLRVFLERAQRVEDGSVRLIAGSSILAVYVSVLHPSGLLDESPTVLGLRTFAISSESQFDAVVPLRSLLMRIESQRPAEEAGEAVTISLPIEVNTVTWTAISPPRGGWQALRTVQPAVLEAAARAGINEIAEAIPTGTGEQIVQRVRTEVWARTLDDPDFLPAGAAFAALTLGFLADEQPVSLFETGSWTRVTSRGGHVLVKRRAWSLSR